jgi:hypothetical protein
MRSPGVNHLRDLGEALIARDSRLNNAKTDRSVDRRGLHPLGASGRRDVARRLDRRRGRQIAGGNYLRIFRAAVG